MISLKVSDPGEQVPLSAEPYDRWISPEGDCMAEFHRLEDGFLVRFPGEADFEIDTRCEEAVATPAPDACEDQAQKLFHNSIEPLVGNHRGGLFLHGSAVVIGDSAVAFLGRSRSGKTTLAGALAKVRYPFLSEDVIELVRDENGYTVRPKCPSLRLFADSARFLFGSEGSQNADASKLSYRAGEDCPYSDDAAPLRALFLIGTNHSAPLAIRSLPSPASLPLMLQHAFVLDVEDRARMKEHFSRIADLAERVPAFTLDYPRDYSALPRVIEAIVSAQAGLETI